MVQKRRSTAIRKQQIIDAARKLIIRRGSEHLTVRALAKEVGLTEAAISIIEDDVDSADAESSAVLSATSSIEAAISIIDEEEDSADAERDSTLSATSLIDAFISSIEDEVLSVISCWVWAPSVSFLELTAILSVAVATLIEASFTFASMFLRLETMVLMAAPSSPNSSLLLRSIDFVRSPRAIRVAVLTRYSMGVVINLLIKKAKNNMATTYKGECFCGAVHAEVSGEPEAMGYCHCQSCRSWSAAPVNAFTLWKPDAMRVTAGAEHVATFQKPNSVNGNTARNAVAIS